MAKLLVLLLVGYVLYQMFKGRSDKKVSGRSDTREETFQDPVCGTYVAKGDAIVGNLEGKKLYFCSMACLEQFREQLQNSEKEKIGGKQ